MKVYVAPISWGLGDGVVSLPVLQNFIDRGDQTYFVVRSQLQSGLAERIRGLAGSIQESQLESLDFNAKEARLVNLREHPIQTNYWWGSQEFENSYPGFKINDILKVICRDFGFAPEFSQLVPLNNEHDSRFEHTVAFIPGSDGTHKQWESERWRMLRGYLQNHGHMVIVLGEPDRSSAVKELIDAGARWEQTATIARAIDVLSSCRAAVGVDTGLTHIAVQQSVPTVALYKKHSTYYRPYSHAVAVEARECTQLCQQKFLSRAINQVTEFRPDFQHLPWQCEATQLDRCMSSIEAEAVVDALSRVLAAAEPKAQA